MNKSNNDFLQVDQNDAIDSYFECVLECSLDKEDGECISRCVEVHLK